MLQMARYIDTSGRIATSRARHNEFMTLNLIVSSSKVNNDGEARHEIAPAIGFVLGLLDAHARSPSQSQRARERELLLQRAAD